MADRLAYDGREHNTMPTLDEVVMSGADVHLEALDDKVFMLIVENADRHLHLRIGPRGGRAAVDAWVYEQFDGDEWAAEVKTHAYPPPAATMASRLAAVEALPGEWEMGGRLARISAVRPTAANVAKAECAAELRRLLAGEADASC